MDFYAHFILTYSYISNTYFTRLHVINETQKKGLPCSVNNLTLVSIIFCVFILINFEFYFQRNKCVPIYYTFIFYFINIIYRIYHIDTFNLYVYTPV